MQKKMPLTKIILAMIIVTVTTFGTDSHQSKHTKMNDDTNKGESKTTQ